MGSSNPNNHGVVANLAGPRMPADKGLAGLGLLLQLFGTVGVAVFTALALIPVFVPGLSFFADGQSSAMLFFGAIGSAIRAATHRAAGTALLYGGTGHPLRSVSTYLVVAALHTAAVLAALGKVGLGAAALAQVGTALLAWPLALAVVFSSPRIRSAARGGVPASEDLGFESTAVLMLLFGLLGALFAGLALAIVIPAPSSLFASPPLLLIGLPLVVLLVRSLLHALAGFRGASGLNFHAASEGTSRYCNFGLLSACLVGAAAFVVGFIFGHAAAALLGGVTAAALLFAWPAILRRFYAEKNFAVLLAGDQAARFRRAPDAGLTALGWLLLAAAAVGLAGSLPPALLGAEGVKEALGLVGEVAQTDAAASARSPWWTVGVACVQLWAAVELVRMSDRYRTATTLYGVVALAVIAFQSWPLISSAGSLLQTSQGVGPGLLLRHVAVGHAAFGLVVAAVSIVLVNRATVPEAVARLRKR